MRGRILIAAVTVGAFTVAGQHAGYGGEPGEHARGVDPLAFGNDASAALTGVGGNEPALGVLPVPELLLVPQDTLPDDVSALAKGERIATERVVAERARAEPATAIDRAENQRSPRLDPRTVSAPVVGRITSMFGPRWGSTHYGLDVANSIGTPIRSATDGEIIDSGPASGFGLWVRVQADDGTTTVYGHINETLVEVGQRVSAGERIATVGNRGNSTGPHLHFEVHQDGKQIDPLKWLRTNGADI